MIRVLVTSAQGQVGAEVARQLEGRAEVAARERGALDLADPSSIRAGVRDVHPDVIVNCAAYTAVDRAETDREAAQAVNALGPGVLAEEAKRCGALLVHFSTDYVYDGTKSQPYVESDAVHPLSVYGATKLEGERQVAGAGAAHLILRTSWVYGPRGRNFLFTMLRLGRERRELRIVDDQRGAPTSSLALARLVGDLLRGGAQGTFTRAAVERLAALGGVYHATAAGDTTWFGFAQAIFEEVGRQGRLDFAAPRLVPIVTHEYPTPARRPANSVLSNAKLQTAFGVAVPDWREGLAAVVSALPG